jgi:hypothetical protein
MNKSKSSYKPNGKAQPFGGKWFLIAVIVVVVILVMFRGEDKLTKTPPVQWQSAIVKTIELTLKPGESKVFPVKDPVTGELCRYVANWKQFTKESLLNASTHGELGYNGVGDFKISSWVKPFLENNLPEGNHNSGQNARVHFVRVQNRGQDTVEFSVDLVGYREVPTKVEIE